MRQEDIEARAVKMWRRAMDETVKEMQKELALLQSRLAALEAKRGPGRPRKEKPKMEGFGT
jgi:hypothetical protein